MKILALAAAVVAALGATAAANADNFDFSYTFSDGQQLTGSFFGLTSNGGQTATGISNVSIALNGIAFAPVTAGGLTYGNATLQLNAWNPSIAAFDNTTPVTIYANGALNNFIVSDVDASINTSPDYEFAVINDAANGINQAVAANFLQSDAFSTAEGNSTQLALDNPDTASSWTLTDVSLTPVPLPGALPMLLSGLGLLGLSRRKIVKSL